MSHRPWRVVFASIPGTLEVFEQLLVDVAEQVPIRSVVEVNVFLDLVDHLPQQNARLHVLVSVLKDAAHQATATHPRILFLARRLDLHALERRKQSLIDKGEQSIAGGTFPVSSPSTPAQVSCRAGLAFLHPSYVNQRRREVLFEQFQFLLAVVPYLEKQQPDELTNALGIAIDAHILAHDVLDGLDRGR